MPRKKTPAHAGKALIAGLENRQIIIPKFPLSASPSPPAKLAPAVIVQTKIPNVVQYTVKNHRWYLELIKETSAAMTFRKYASVTFVLSTMAKPELDFWKARHTVEEQHTILEEAGYRGTRIHRAMEKLAQGVKLDFGRHYDWLEGGPLTDDESQAVAELLRFLEIFQPLILHTEQTVLHPDGFAGTLDGGFMIDEGLLLSWNDARSAGKLKRNGNNVLCLVDYKSGSGIYDDHKMQMAAYAACVPEAKYGLIVKSGAKNELGFQLHIMDLHKPERPYYDCFQHLYRGPFQFHYGNVMPEFKGFAQGLQYRLSPAKTVKGKKS